MHACQVVVFRRVTGRDLIGIIYFPSGKRSACFGKASFPLEETGWGACT